jgi:glycosyltransferase involved in cell wall biosynthesis
MRILQVTPYYPPHVGGIEYYVEALSREFTAMGHDVTVATMSDGSGLPRLEDRDGVHIVRFPRLGTDAYGFPVGLGLYLLKNAGQYDIIHAHNYHALPFLVTAGVCGSRVIVNPYFHGGGHSRLANLMHRVYQPAAAPLMRRARAVICNSTSEAQLVVEKLRVKPERVTFIPNIVTGSTPARPARSSPDGLYRLLSVGRLEAHKRIDRALKVLHHLPASFHLAIIGTGTEQASLDHLVTELDLTGRVQFLGHVSDAELHQWYGQSNLVVTFSEAESFGRVLVESLQHGCRVVCSPIPAFRDLAEQFPEMITTVTAEAGDQAIASLIQTISTAARPEPADLGQFSAPHVAGQVLRIYSQASPLLQTET